VRAAAAGERAGDAHHRSSGGDTRGEGFDSDHTDHTVSYRCSSVDRRGH
jgi:hypothetical protein